MTSKALSLLICLIVLLGVAACGKTATPEPSATVAPQPTATLIAEPTATIAPKPSATATPEPSATAAPTATATEPAPSATATAAFLFSNGTTSAKVSADAARQRSLLFCVPPNDKLLGYWDRVEDRLYKVRNCLNLQGVRRQLPLFQPPIDPGLLVRAKAAGLSLEDILAFLAADLPAYRFTFMLERARAFTTTVQSLGSALLNALEKKDAEELSVLRVKFEHEVHKLIERSKQEQINEAEQNLNALNESYRLAEIRKDFYQGLLDADKIEEEIDYLELNEESKAAYENAGKQDKKASSAHAIPNITLTVGIGKPVGISIGTSLGGSNFGPIWGKRATASRTKANRLNLEASSANFNAAYRRRHQEWKFHRDSAAQELNQLNKQILAAEFRLEFAQRDLAAQQRQIEQTEELHELYKDKFTNLGLYTYLSASLSRLYREAYNLAHDMALQAQQAYRFETDDDTFFVGNDNWPTDKAGLLAGERLLLQLQQMEKAHLERNRREYEITLPCSLAQINPEALLWLRQTGSCDFSIPEIWFDLYYPGQYKRRVKSVRLTIPCVTGPYTNVSAKLTLTGSRMRTEPQLEGEVRAIQAQRNTSVATSSANNDAGVFELNFRDERYLPFEGAGANSDWRLELPSVLRPFDYDTISDVILHISYTAKDDGRFKEEVETNLAHGFADMAATEGLVRFFSLKGEFPTALHQLQHPPQAATPGTEIRLDKRHFPYFLQDQKITLEEAIVILKPKEGEALDVDDLELRLNDGAGGDWDPFPPEDVNSQLRANSFSVGEPLDPAGNVWSLVVTQGELAPVEDVWMLVIYRVNA